MPAGRPGQSPTLPARRREVASPAAYAADRPPPDPARRSPQIQNREISHEYL